MTNAQTCLDDLVGIAHRPMPPDVMRWLAEARVEEYEHDLAEWSMRCCSRAGEFSLAPLRGGLKERLHGILALRRRPERELEVFEYAYSLL
jgi:hypothetical protein